MQKTKAPFWKTKKFKQMSKDEWESLCDGCGLCCLHKLEDADSGEVSYTNVACRLLDTQTCRCKKYADRKKLVPDCIILTPEDVSKFQWLPETCAYRLIAEGKPLYSWHPLLTGSALSVHEAGISIIGNLISEREAGDLQDHLIDLKTCSLK